jgi:uncharacterized membrane protein YidH (DUF202 family)
VAHEKDLPPWDPGLQNERTELAWQRTLLSGLAWGLLVARLLADVSLALAILTGVLATGTSATFAWTAMRRFRRDARALDVGGTLGDGRPCALAALLLLVTGAGAAVFVLFG